MEDDSRFAVRVAADLPIHKIPVAHIEHAMVVRFDFWVGHCHTYSLPLVEVYRKNAEGRFELFEARADDTVELASVGVLLAVRALYANPLDR